MSKKYPWKPGGELPELDAHSIAKHRVLERYLGRYIEVLTADPRRDELRLHLVDGFCGGGLYRYSGESVRGSPLILLDTVRESEAACQARRRKAFSISAHYYFMDKDQQALAHLKHVLQESDYHGEQVDNVDLIPGAFEEKVGQVIHTIRQRSRSARALFLLDQFGYKDVPLDSMRSIFTSLPNAEIVLNFATDSLVNFLKDSEISRKSVGRVGDALLSRLNLDRIERLKSQDADWRLVIEKELSDALRIESGAKYATRFFIRSVQSNRAYWLVHLCQHPRAHQEMLLLHWTMHNTFSRMGPAGFWVPGYDPRADRELDMNEVFDFDFDDLAAERSVLALRNELPDLIAAQDGMTFRELQDHCFNNTPVHREMIQNALMDMTHDAGVEILIPNGGRRRSAQAIQDDDVVRRHPQDYWHF